MEAKPLKEFQPDQDHSVPTRQLKISDLVKREMDLPKTLVDNGSTKSDISLISGNFKTSTPEFLRNRSNLYTLS